MTTKDDYPPLVSDRSPSNARAQEERKNPSPTGDPGQVAALAERYERQENARRAYAAAASRFADPGKAKQAEADAARHAASRDQLGEQIVALGGAAPQGDEVRQLLRSGAKDVERAGDDAAIAAVLAQVAGEI
jgi:hypothetical protein